MTEALASVFADEWGRVVASLVRITGDWALAEDAAQDAFAAAAVAWPRDGMPRVPGAWLTTVARNRGLDRLRRISREQRAVSAIATLQEEDAMGSIAGTGTEPDDVPDERLRLIFTCCHPALPLESRVALTLRTLCGLTVDEIAAAFAVSEPTMAKRLVRARAKIQKAHIPYRVPSGAALPERTAGVLAVLYLLFSEGYAPSGGDAVVRASLSDEAIRLARVLARLLPGESEVLGLLALLLFQDSRRAARTAADGSLVPLDEQDRSLWDARRIADGRAALAGPAGAGPAGAYRLQALVAAEHARGPAADRAAIVRHYDALAMLTPSPFVALARAIAVGAAHGPDAGLAALARLRASGALAGNHYLPSAEADLLRRAGRSDEAAVAYRAALDLVKNEAERRYLARRLVEVSA